MIAKTSKQALALVAISALLVLPTVVSPAFTNASIQMLIAALFACAFNLLAGQGGLLSFGHAAYFGVGAFATIHAMRAAGGAGLLPTALLPLAGAVVGLAVGIATGWFATKRAGTYFAMITLALAELMHALAPQLAALFGGEAGLSGMRAPSWGLNFGTTTQLYYVTLVWVLTSLLLLYLFTLTPVGRLTLGLRENPHRLRFLGYNVHHLAVLTFALSAMFSGIAGGLLALNNEAVNYSVFDATLSTGVVLNTFIGGVSVFLGPALGAVLMTFFGNAVSDLTRSWLLYQGILFVLVMMFMPLGLAGFFRWLVSAHRSHGIARLLPVVALGVLAGTVLSAGTVFLVEMLQGFFSRDYRAIAAANPGMPWPPIALAGRSWPPSSVLTWLVPVGLLVLGVALVRAVRSQWLSLNAKPETSVDSCATASAAEGN